MRLGISFKAPRSGVSEWAGRLQALSCGAVVFPLDHSAGDKLIDSYAAACRDHGLVIAEVGAWRNPMHPNPEERRKNIRYCQMQLQLAEYIGAKCCVNISGARGDVWDGGYSENYSADTYRAIIDTTREIIDAVKPKRSFYTLEPMPWMLPDSPETYLRLLGDVDRRAFAVHMDAVNMISSPERYFFNSVFIEKCFRLLGPRVKSCHVKDVRLERFLTFNLKEIRCGDGNLDVVTYAREAEKADPDMPFIIEHLNSEEEYTESLSYVKSLLEKSGVSFWTPA
jgi:sugar phosphate isomerase/epimerase